MTAIRAEELLKRKVGRFLTHFANRWSSNSSLKDVLGEVRGSHWKAKVDEIRQLEVKINSDISETHSRDLKTKKSKLKSELPAVMISGVGNRKPRINKTEPSFVHSGLLQIDLDMKDHAQLTSAEIIELLKNDPHILACFLSPSGGVKGICAISQNEEDHLGCFLAAEEHFKRLGLIIDKQPKNTKSLCYLSHDPNPYIASGDVIEFKPLEHRNHLVHTMTQSPNDSITQKLNNSEEYNIRGVVEKIGITKQIDEKVLKWKEMEGESSGRIKIWEEMIERRYIPKEGCRNDDLCDFIAYSISRLDRGVALEMAMLMRELWAAVYNDPIDQHMYEARFQWDACEYSFTAILGEAEKMIYKALDERRRSVFRIFRGLAFYEDGKASKGEFFLSCRDLGNRLGISYKYANRLLNEFAYDFGLICEIEKGLLSGRQATRYGWSLGF